MKIVSLFSGCGGLDLGFALAGHNIIYANDNNKWACLSHMKNFGHKKVICGDISKVDSFPEGDILVGGYPCQSFSIAGNLIMDDPRNTLYTHFSRCLETIKPKFFVAENVDNLTRNKYKPTFKAMINTYKKKGYRVVSKVINAADYGVPQERNRVIMVGVRKDIDFKYKFPRQITLKKKTVLRDAIWDLQNNPGQYYSGRYSPRFMSRNRVRDWDELSYTVVATADQNPIHPNAGKMVKVERDKFKFSKPKEEVRTLSVRECARIMTFPDSFVFEGSIKDQYKQIGNAVPPLLAFNIAKKLPLSIENGKWIMSNVNFSYNEIIHFDMEQLRNRV